MRGVLKPTARNRHIRSPSPLAAMRNSLAMSLPDTPLPDAPPVDKRLSEPITAVDDQTRVKLPEIRDLSGFALFLDFDGTLANIALEPGMVHVNADTRAVVAQLLKSLGGAVAIVTGREIADIDRLLAPHQLPVAGVHGAMRRDASGKLYFEDEGRDPLRDLRAELIHRLGSTSGILIEQKRGAIAVHYRLRPELEPMCLEVMSSLVASSRNVRLQTGKMVAEILSARVNKGAAIRSYLAEPPFVDRLPVFAGDDATDEDGFATVNGLAGISIKIGAGQSVAKYRMQSAAQFRDWLARMAQASGPTIGDSDKA